MYRESDVGGRLQRIIGLLALDCMGLWGQIMKKSKFSIVLLPRVWYI